jgi:hypothetical protein
VGAADIDDDGGIDLLPVVEGDSQNFQVIAPDSGNPPVVSELCAFGPGRTFNVLGGQARIADIA